MDIGQTVGPGKERGDLFYAVAGDSAANARHEEGQLRMAVRKQDELIDLAGDGPDGTAHRRDGITLPLQAAALSVHGAEVLQREACGAAVVVSGLVGAEHEDLARLKRGDDIRGHAHRGLLLGEEVVVKVELPSSPLALADLLVELPVAGVHLVPHHLGATLGGFKVHRTANAQPGGREAGVLVRANEGERPALLAEGVDQFLHHGGRIVGGTVLEPVRDDGHEDVVALLDDCLQFRNGKAHCVVERSAAGGGVLVLAQVFHLVDGVAENQRPHVGPPSPGVECDEGDHLVVVRVLLLRLPDGLERLVRPGECLGADSAHRAAFVEDDQIVDVGFGGVVRGVHCVWG